MKIDDVSGLPAQIAELKAQIRALQTQAGLGFSSADKGMVRIGPDAALNCEGPATFAGNVFATGGRFEFANLPSAAFAGHNYALIDPGTGRLKIGPSA